MASCFAWNSWDDLGLMHVPLFLKPFSQASVFKLTRLSFISFFLQGSNVMEDQDLREIGITDPSHRKKILHAARSLPKVRNHWLLLKYLTQRNKT